MTTTASRPRADVAPDRFSAVRVTQGRVLTSEGIKLRSQRSVRWLVLASVLSIVAAALSTAVTAAFADDPAPGGAAAGTDPLGGALTGVSFTQVIIGALGVLVVTSEYSTGLIRATFAAVPTRLPVLWAKAAVTAVVVFVATLAAAFISFFAARAVLSAADVSLSLGAPGVLRALVGSALYLTVTAVLAVAFGWLVRSAIGAMAALFGLLFLVPLLGMLLPATEPYLPTNAGAAILQVGSTGGALSPWAGLAVFTAYAVVALIVAAVALTRRDA
jgi:ABC-type transport system involved in multi-copper enzyme maturation permease subunit